MVLFVGRRRVRCGRVLSSRFILLVSRVHLFPCVVFCLHRMRVACRGFVVRGCAMLMRFRDLRLEV